MLENNLEITDPNDDYVSHKEKQFRAAMSEGMRAYDSGKPRNAPYRDIEFLQGGWYDGYDCAEAQAEGAFDKA